MNNRRLFAVFAAFGLTLGASALAHADEQMTIVDSQFTTKVDQSKPVDDAEAASHAKTVTFFVIAKNPGATQNLTFVWKRDGKEVLTQHLDVGTSPRWRTWGSCAVLGAHEMEIEVKDDAGHVLQTSKLEMK